MTPDEMTEYLHQAVPLSAIMGVEVVKLSTDISVVTASHQANVNHEGTVFGGSMSALALLCGYAVALNRMTAAGRRHRIVIQRNTCAYLRPAASDITAHCQIDTAGWEDLIDSLGRRGTGKLSFEVVISDASDRRVARLTGVFAFLPPHSR